MSTVTVEKISGEETAVVVAPSRPSKLASLYSIAQRGSKKVTPIRREVEGSTITFRAEGMPKTLDADGLKSLGMSGGKATFRLDVGKATVTTGSTLANTDASEFVAGLIAE